MSGQDLGKGIDGEDGDPAHEEVESGGEPAGGHDPDHRQKDTGDGQRPNDPKESPAPGAPQAEQADRGVTPGDEQVNGGVVQPAEIHPPFGGIADAVIEGAGGIEADHGKSIDGEDRQAKGAAHLGRPNQQKDRSDHAQQDPGAVGDGRPGAQAVIGVPALLSLQLMPFVGRVGQYRVWS